MSEKINTKGRKTDYSAPKKTPRCYETHPTKKRTVGLTGRNSTKNNMRRRA